MKLRHQVNGGNKPSETTWSQTGKYLRLADVLLLFTLFIGLLTFPAIAQSAKGRLVTLFNGKDLTGWNVHGTEKWYVQDGLLICESGPDKQYGYLATHKEYKDFELMLEFRQEANGNSGVFFRSSLDGVKVSGWQAEVAPPGHDTGGIYESYGRGWLQQIPEAQEKYLKMGKWNQMKLRVVGSRVTTWLNGHQMVDFTDEKIGAAGRGVIALQIHDGGGIKVRWRKLMLRDLDEAVSAE